MKMASRKMQAFLATPTDLYWRGEKNPLLMSNRAKKFVGRFFSPCSLCIKQMSLFENTYFVNKLYIVKYFCTGILPTC